MLRKILFLPLLLFALDYDTIVIGSSPFSMLEAIYQARTGHKTLIIEASDRCGGAWQAIDICGIQGVDLGCHHIGKDKGVRDFLEEYVGCRTVSLYKSNYYFESGCRDLIEHLETMLYESGVDLLLNTKADDVYIQDGVTVHAGASSWSAAKLILTPMSSVRFPQAARSKIFASSKHYHLYMLIQDANEPRFDYRSGIGNGTSRLMNLTRYASLEGTGRQLIAIQTHAEKDLGSAELFLETMKKQNLISQEAYILETEPYIYTAGKFNQSVVKELDAEDFVEVLQTGLFQGMSAYIARWKEALTRAPILGTQEM